MIAVATAMHPDVNWHIATQKGFRLFDKPMPETHAPEIGSEIQGLHKPRPIPGLQDQNETLLYTR